MKIFLALFLSLSFILGQTFAATGVQVKEIIKEDELAMLDTLIESTKRSLENQKLLKEQLQNYQKLLAMYLESGQNKEIMYKLVKVAFQVSESIKENHLSQVFSESFMSELNVFAQIGAKRGIPKP